MTARFAFLSRWPALCLIILAFTFFKYPTALLHGRFLAEEASIFANNLLGTDFVFATFYIYKGSLQILTNWSVWAALQVPLEHAPYVTTWLGVTLQLIFAAQFGIWARAQRIAPIVAVVGLAGFALLPSNFEIAASATNMQWVCSLCCLLMLFTPPETLGKRMRLYATWALLCGLTGVPSSMLAPGFLARAWFERSKPHAIIGAILSLTSLLQLFLIATTSLGERSFVLDGWHHSVALALQVVWQPLIGNKISVLSVAFMPWNATISSVPVGLAIVAVAFVILAWAVWAAARGGATRLLLALLVATGLGVTLLNIYGSLHPPALMVRPLHGARYFAIAGLCFAMLLMIGTRSPDRKTSWFSAAMLGWILFLGVAQLSFSKWPYFYTQGPLWQPQVAACRQRPDRDCYIVNWPDPKFTRTWVFRLPAERPEQPKTGARSSN